jgi:hypothetical protein
VETSEPIQIDPRGCGCTECITGLYVPLEHATVSQLLKAAHGLMSNATGLDASGLELIAWRRAKSSLEE